MVQTAPLHRAVDQTVGIGTVRQRIKRPVASKRTLRTLSIVAPIVVLLVWELFSRTGVLDQRFFPAPTLVIKALWDEATTGSLWVQSGHSVVRLIVGFLLGAVPAIVLGVIMGLSKVVNAILRPIVSAIYPIPKSAVFPLFLLFFGLGEDAIWWFVAVGVFFPVVMNTYTGVSNVAQTYYDVADNFGASKAQVFRTVALPGAMPSIITGVELGAGLGLIMLALAEMMGGQGNGWGFQVWNSFQLFKIETMYAYLLVFAIVGVLFAALVGAIGRALTPWTRRR